MGAHLHFEVCSFYFTSFNLFIYFYEERKGGENFRKKKTKKNKFRCKVIKGLHKLKNSVWFVHRTHTNVIIYITIA